jgi:acyl dehydratase
MSEILPEIPEKVLALIDKKQYEQESDFEIHMSYVNNTCAAVQNGNPLYWDDRVAKEVTGGQIAPPTMLSVWFRPHFWSPGFEAERTALQVHFDMKILMDVPEAIIGGNEMVFGVPVRMGDVLTTYQVLRSVSDVKTTRLGAGRFWNIDVEAVNQHGDHVGTDKYSCFGYRGVK